MNSLPFDVPPGDSRPEPVVNPTMRERVYARTRELAAAAGRPFTPTQRDYEQARCEITGESDRARQEAVLEGSAPQPAAA